MTHGRPKDTLTLRTPLVATPNRVAELAAAISELAASAGPVGESLTLVVENLAGRLTLRAWDASGEELLKRMKAVAGNPMARIQHAPEDRPIALAMSVFAKRTEKYRPKFFESNHLLVALDETFVRATRAAGTLEPQPTDELTGDISVLTRILRVGRVDEAQPLRVRITLDGDPIEADVKGEESGFFDAAKHGREVPVTLFVRWTRESSGKLKIDRGSIKAVDVDGDWRPVSGAALLEATKHLTKPSLSEMADLADEMGWVT